MNSSLSSSDWTLHLPRSGGDEGNGSARHETSAEVYSRLQTYVDKFQSAFGAISNKQKSELISGMMEARHPDGSQDLINVLRQQEDSVELGNIAPVIATTVLIAIGHP